MQAQHPTSPQRPVHIRIAGASRSFGAVAAVDGVSLSITAQSFTALVGPSGCGKTTLMRMMGGLEPADAGTVERAAGTTSFCFQEPRLLAFGRVEQRRPILAIVLVGHAHEAGAQAVAMENEGRIAAE
jgi:ABC-type nitrate/sulfonate/bicarbonate transport system ATPase subunit